MNDVLAWIGSFFTSERMMVLARAGLILVLGLMVARLVNASLVAAVSKRLAPQHTWLLRRVSWYTMVTLVAVSVLRELGLKLDVLLGAAGILTVAVGFASQTSASNLISGIFLIIERPFGVGDVIRVGDLTGEVVAIDLLSVKIRTFDNLFARVPNESLIKSQITNLTYFPIRRLDMPIGVAYKEDLTQVRTVLLSVVDETPLCLQEPAPVFIVNGYGDSAINLLFCVWVKRENLLEVRNTLYDKIKKAFDRKGIEIPFPHRTLYPGAVSGPFKIEQVPPPEPIRERAK